MSTLTHDDIKTYLHSDRDLKRRLVVRPLLDPERQIKECGIDLRLNNQFIVFQQQNLSHVDPSSEEFKSKLRRYQIRLIVPFRRRDGLVLHPGQLVLGSTIEYVGMPTCLEGQVEGRSSWARLGLSVVSASTVAPSFKGVITLELANHGVAPLILWPGVRIANLVLHEVKSPCDYLGKKYICPIGPEFSKVHQDYDTLFWKGNPEVLGKTTGWYSSLEEKLKFPFTATCITERAISPLCKGDEAEVLKMAPEGECGHEMFVRVRSEKLQLGPTGKTAQDTKTEKLEMAVPLFQLKPTAKTDKETKEAVADWHYWVAQAYEL